MLRPTCAFAGVAVVFFGLFALGNQWETAIWLWWIGVSNLLLAIMFGLFWLMERVAPMPSPKTGDPTLSDPAIGSSASKISLSSQTQNRKAA